MIGIVIVAHGGLAKEYLAALEHVVGHHPGVRAVTIAPDDDRAAKQQEIAQYVADVDDGSGVVLVTDMFGGTPSNLAMAVSGRDDRKVLYGANLPMLDKLAKARGGKLDTAVDCALAAGRKYIDCVEGTQLKARALSA